MMRRLVALTTAALALFVGLPSFAQAATQATPAPPAAPAPPTLPAPPALPILEPTPAPHPVPCTGRCSFARVPIPANVHVLSNRIQILLPNGYANSTARYPVIYAMCGAGGGETEWTDLSDLTSYSASLKAIFVMPDCGGGRTPGWYSNWADGEYQWETYYIKYVLPWVNRNLRSLRHHNGIMGLSMGGYGALELAARHPAMFKTVASFSGLLDTQVGSPATDMVATPSKIWGSPGSTYYTNHNPTALAANLKGKALFLTCGTGAPVSTARPTAAPSSNYSAQVEEQYLFDTHVPFVAALEKNGIPFTSNFYAGGDHTWAYFQYDAHWAIPQMLRVLSA